MTLRPPGISSSAAWLVSRTGLVPSAPIEYDASLLAEGAAWIAAALERKQPARAAEWRAHAERALAAVYPAGHPWRESLAGTRR